jgi:prephenate dehydratase
MTKAAKTDSPATPASTTAISAVSASAITFAFQGELGAFSENAGHGFFGLASTALACRNFDELFGVVEDGQADAAVVPIENTLAGAINKNYDLLLEHHLVIVGEAVLRVVHNVIGVPGATLAEIRRVYSHPVALAQCERFLREHPSIEAVAAYDTAGSVKMVMEAGRRDEAAIAAASAAEVYGATILVPGVESNPQNFTRFLIVARTDRAGAVQSRAAALANVANEIKTSVVLSIGHRPGGLYHALAAFADEGINLTKIESRPIPGKPFEYWFYLDFIGRPEQAPVERALAQLRALAESVRVLGTYPRAETPS